MPREKVTFDGFDGSELAGLLEGGWRSVLPAAAAEVKSLEKIQDR